MDTLNLTQLRQDIEAIGLLPGWSVTRLARESGAEQGSLSRFLRGKTRSLNGETLERLWPFLYGDRRPTTDEAA